MTRFFLRAASVAATLGSAATAVLAHAGHGAPLWHTHGEVALGAAVVVLALGGGLQWATRDEPGSALHAWGWRLATVGALGAALLLLGHV